MPRRLASDVELVVASHNAGKVEEIAALFAPHVARVVSAGELDLPEPAEDADTFLAIASDKARRAATLAERPAIADDSGLSVARLGGAPGIRSARWAGTPRDFGAAMERVNRLAPAGSAAEMVTALALAWPDGHVEAFEGRVEGVLTWPPRGAHGFGYEPMFVPGGQRRTYGEMPRPEKHADDPRARAFRALLSACLSPRGRS